MTVAQPSVVSRFVKLVDQFYDHRVRVILTAATDVTHLFDEVFAKEQELSATLAKVVVGGVCDEQKGEIDLMQKGRLSAISSLVFSCRRTQSRLVEMTGKEYLAKHAAAHGESNSL